jgi:hypothetical protein
MLPSQCKRAINFQCKQFYFGYVINREASLLNF